MKGWLVAALCLAIFVGIFLLFLLPKQPTEEAVVPKNTFDISAYLQNLQSTTSDPLRTIETDIVDIMDAYGLDAGFAVVREAEAQRIINNDGCHAILHYVGHAAYNTYRDDFISITAPVEGTSCIGGYIHGVEAEILLGSDNPIEDVQRFCTYTNERKITPGSCYHGVGHAAAELYDYNPHEALTACDALAGGPEDDLRNCYRGVFSEVGNVVLGIDGHTGQQQEQLAVLGLTRDNPYTWCNTFASQYQSSCKSQLTKLLTDGLPMDDYFLPCLSNTLSSTDQAICVNITTVAYVRNQLSFASSTPLPANINDLPLEQQRVAVLGSLEAFSGYRGDSKERTWNTLCGSFSSNTVKTECNEAFIAYTENNISPWEQRDDIR